MQPRADLKCTHARVEGKRKGNAAKRDWIGWVENHLGGVPDTVWGGVGEGEEGVGFSTARERTAKSN